MIRYLFNIQDIYQFSYQISFTFTKETEISTYIYASFSISRICHSRIPPALSHLFFLYQFCLLLFWGRIFIFSRNTVENLNANSFGLQRCRDRSIQQRKFCSTSATDEFFADCNNTTIDSLVNLNIKSARRTITR